jgi:hypothetical protein
MTYVISGFSGIGKSTAAEHNDNVVDFESSTYSHFEDGTINPEFPNNYVVALDLAIKKNPDKIYLVSCHKNVRELLSTRGISYIVVAPYRDQRNDYMIRWLKRGSSQNFIASMYYRWDDMINSCENDPNPVIWLDDGQYLEHILSKNN